MTRPGIWERMQAYCALMRCTTLGSTRTACCLAREVYESRDFGPMPVLADALEDAGCVEPEILAHCRGEGPHVRGCWVVDLVLGRE